MIISNQWNLATILTDTFIVAKQQNNTNILMSML